MRYIRAQCHSCFGHADFSAQNIACGLSTERMKWRASDSRTIHTYKHTYIHFAHDIPVYVGLAQAHPNNVRLWNSGHAQFLINAHSCSTVRGAEMACVTAAVNF